jgi:tRNA(adenine34) deaminase
MSLELPTDEDIFFMKAALKIAEISSRRDEVPIACVLVRKNKVLVESGNHKHAQTNPMAHAECEVIQESSRVLKNWRLEKTTLYVTTEPCLMCTGLIYAARIPKVVFGCKNPKGGSLLYIEERRKELNLNHSVEIVSGVMEEESAKLLKNFFGPKRERERFTS